MSPLFPYSFLETQMYFKLLSVHAVAMTSVVSNPLLYFWMSKVRLHYDIQCSLQRHRRALRDDMYWLTNARRHQQQQVGGLLAKFTPSPSIGLLYRKSLERHLLQNAAANYSPYRCVSPCISKFPSIPEDVAHWPIRRL